MQNNNEVYADTVGKPINGVELKIGENGEVLYRSVGSFKEYYKNPKATKETKDKDGWVATGDAGYMDENTGQLRIIDRANSVGKLKNGALFAPKYVENKLKFFLPFNILTCDGLPETIFFHSLIIFKLKSSTY